MSTVSRHLTQLKNAGIVESEKRGQMVFYRLRVKCLKSLFGCIESVLNARRSAPGDLLADGENIVFISQQTCMFFQICNKWSVPMSKEWKIFAAFLAIFLVAYFVPLATPQFDAEDRSSRRQDRPRAIVEAFVLLQWYARNHTLACVVPALFIAGAITTFLSKESVLKHLGPKANKVEAYSVASVSGTVLAVCSCSVLPMFAGIYRVGAGLGPAACFLYAGPAINVLAIFLTARVLGFELGVARVIGAVVFGVIIGLIMAVIFRRSEESRSQATMADARPAGRRAAACGRTPRCLAACSPSWSSATGSTRATSTCELADGTQFEADAAIRNARTRYDLRLKQAALGHQPGEVVRLAKAEIDAIEDVDTWVTRIHHVRWYLAGAMGVLVVADELVLARQARTSWSGWATLGLLQAAGARCCSAACSSSASSGPWCPRSRWRRWWATTA